ncbi:glycosyltransferase [Arthrobacter sp. AFG20]|uniref:glycosyltransferase n=1 Tax=Arthrobacter sp. AFG20 TaxID=1688671 RepID=UPI000C9E247D|nr:glycosyltransferase [Arthrobacter sp. AFG20]PNH84585.1 glycosyl transferase [Arthrobacter sp. AFG20]
MSTATKSEAQGVSQVGQAWRVLQRVILPSQSQMDTVPLYLDTGTATGVQLPTSNLEANSRTQAQTVSAPSKEAHVEDFLTRHSTSVRPGERVSFGSYFNAFAASYWRRWTTVKSVRLSVSTVGSGSVIVYKSNARGALQRVDSRNVDGGSVSTFDLTLAPFGDGGWYWFDLVAGSEPLVLRNAEWLTEGDNSRQGSATLQITTLNKTEFCINNLKLLAENPDALEHIKELVVVDQGTQKVSDADGFAEVAAALDGKLRIINQDNLGGSGGFARGMYEAVENGSDYVLLMDDDVVVEPESISRMLTFADLCKTPTIVGGHMFDLYNRTVLHTFGEVVNPWRFLWEQSREDMLLGHDFQSTNLRQTSWLHRRADVDFNGWWMSLIPTRIIREIGLALPVFIKWDDAEYSLRAKEHGYPTVSMPGAAVWHVSWIDKDDLVGWQAYFHARNRFIAALVHSPYEFGGRIVRESHYADIKHLVSMQYATARGRNMALRDLLRGPGQLHEQLAKKLPEIRDMMKNYPDSVIATDPDAFPAAKLDKPPKHGHGVREPNKLGLIPIAAKTVLRQLVQPVAPSSQVRPQANVAHQDNRWWRMSQYDSAVVTNAEGTGSAWYKRDPKELRSMLAESVRLHSVLLKDWKRLSAEYKAALPEITSIQTWKKTFDTHSERVDER